MYVQWGHTMEFLRSNSPCWTGVSTLGFCRFAHEAFLGSFGLLIWSFLPPKTVNSKSCTEARTQQPKAQISNSTPNVSNPQCLAEDCRGQGLRRPCVLSSGALLKLSQGHPWAAVKLRKLSTVSIPGHGFLIMVA